MCRASRPQLAEGPQARRSPAWRRCPPRSLPQGIPEGAGAEPPHSGDASWPGWPRPASPSRPDASYPPPYGRPAPSPRGRPLPGRTRLATSPEPESPASGPPGARAAAEATTGLSGRRPSRDSSSQTPTARAPWQPRRPVPGPARRRRPAKEPRREAQSTAALLTEGPAAGERGLGARAHEGLGSKSVEVVATPAQLLRVVRRHEGEVAEDVQIRLVSCLALSRFGLPHLCQS